MAWQFEFIDGFEDTNSTALLNQKWREYIGSPHDPCLSGSGFSYSGGRLAISSGSSIFWKRPGSTLAHQMINLIVERSTDTDRILLSSYDAGTPAPGFELKWRADGKMELFDGAGVSQGTSTQTYLAGIRHILDFEFKPGTTQTFQLWRNTVLDRSWTATTAANSNRLYFGGNFAGTNSGPTLSFDHVLMSTDTGATAPTALGECAVLVRNPNGIGTIQNWGTPGMWADLNETILDTSNFVDVTDATTGARSYFTFPGIVSPYNILGAQINMGADAQVSSLNNRVFGYYRASGVENLVSTYGGNGNLPITTPYYYGGQGAFNIGGYGTGFVPSFFTNSAVMEFGLAHQTQRGHGFDPTPVTRIYQMLLEVILHGPPPVTAYWRVGSVGFA